MKVERWRRFTAEEWAADDTGCRERVRDEVRATCEQYALTLVGSIRTTRKPENGKVKVHAVATATGIPPVELFGEPGGRTA